MKKKLCCTVDPYWQCVLCLRKICYSCGKESDIYFAKCPKSKKEGEHLYANIERLISLKKVKP